MRLLTPLLEGVAPPAYDRLAARFGFASPTQACNAVTTGKRMFIRLLRSVVAGYVQNDGSVDEELKELKAVDYWINGMGFRSVLAPGE